MTTGKIIRAQDIIDDLTRNYPDEDLDGDSLRPMVELAHKLVAYFTIENGDSATSWFIFTEDTTEEEIKDICALLRMNPDGNSCCCSRDCCGHWSSYGVRIEEGINSLYRYAYQTHYRNV